MKRKFYIILFFAILAGGFPYMASAKNALMPKYSSKKDSIKPNKALKEARMYLKMGQYHRAINYYKQYYRSDSNNYHLTYQLAELNYMLARYEAAAPLFLRVANMTTPGDILGKGYAKFLGKDYERKHPPHPLARYFAAMAYKYIGRCDIAKIQFGSFIYEYDEPDAAYLKSRAQLEIDGCNMMFKLREYQGRIFKDRLELPRRNYEKVPHAPVFINDSFIMFNLTGHYSYRNNVWQRSWPISATRTEGFWSQNNYLYYRRNKRQGFYKKEPYQEEPEEFIINGTFSIDKKRFFFTKCDVEINKRMPQHSVLRTYLTNCDLYYCDYRNGRWGKHNRLPENINLPGYKNIMPNMGTDSAGNEILYFVSDRPGGFGETDIWFSIYDAGKRSFSDPVNAGAPVNTQFEESTPFYDSDSAILYYSTNGCATFGGKDVFASKGSLTNWQEPQNLGKPINTTLDDDYFILNSDKTEGFICSGHFPTYSACFNTSNSKYIYYLKFNAPTITFRINVFNKENNKLLDSSKVENLFLERNGNYLPIESYITTPKNALIMPVQFGREYKLEASKNGFYMADTIINTERLKVTDTIEIPLFLKPVPEPPMVIHNIYFGFDDAVLTQESKRAIDSTLLIFMYLNPTAIIEIGAHTDSYGNADYNLKLSQWRAESVADHLIKKGVNPLRLKSKGYGATQPLVSETNIDGSDNPERRQTNRRVEFRILQK